MQYRALVGIKGTKLAGQKKAAREEYHLGLMRTILKRWDSLAQTQPYWDPWFKTDEVYASILQKGAHLNGVNIDDPLEVMNLVGKNTGHVFYTSIPAEDKKRRDKKRRDFENKTKKYKRQHKKVPDELLDEKRQCEEPKPAPKTKLYAYSVVNPNGMFTKYNFPIENSYNGIDVESSKLVNRNYGTMHDILLLGDLDFESTFLPSVVFRHDGEVYEGDDAEEIRNFLYETLDREDYVALIECEA